MAGNIPLFLDLAAAVFGLIMGSAVTAIAHRVPRDISWVSERSACTSCGHRLGPIDLVPLFSWLSTLGHCRHCRARIAARYPLTELLCAVWAVLLVRHHGLDFATPWLLIWGFLLVALMWIDLDFQLLPDVLTFPGTLVALVAILPTPGGASHALWGVVLGSGLLSLLAAGYYAVRKVDGMGGGDIKLAAMFGVILGWKLTLFTLFLAALAGSLWGLVLILRRRGDGMTALPFGTLLAPAAMVSYLWGDAVFQGYFDFVFGR